MPDSRPAATALVPIRKDLFTLPLSPLGDVRLVGTDCKTCGEVSLGQARMCPNCAATDVTPLPLSTQGVVWTYTVIRHRPPGEYQGPDPFVPFGLGLVELPEGLRVLAPLDGDIESLHVGMEVELVVFQLYRDTEDNGVVAFEFRAL